MAAQDFEFTTDMVIDTVTGDFKVIESDQQHQEHILKAKKGQFYEFPTLGADSNSLQNSTATNESIKQLIRENLEADNYRVNRVVITGRRPLEIQIDSIRKK